ncbi:profilin-2-like [Syngnathus typhle]|uniref:profilin-2-like n=1 Tax=Syngnathus typhle TaxID=161592 RepID=UPI002A6AC7D0|nr:profilin-2-like [Syngnathus typhle]
MSWDGYVQTLMAEHCQDAAIIGYPDNKYVWASHEGGDFAKITPAEIDALMSNDRQSFFINGLTLGSEKCSVIRDRLEIENEWGMDLRTKSSTGPTFNIALCRARKVFVLVKGKEGVYGGTLNTLAFKTVEYLRNAGY